MPATIRERILAQIKTDFLKVQKGVDEHVITWNVVERSGIDDTEQQMSGAIGITEGTEQSDDELQTVRKTLELFTEFWIRPMLGDDKSVFANDVLGDVQRTIRGNPTVIEDGTGCQLAIDTKEVRNELDLETEDLIGGVVIWNVVFRHDQDDPRKRNGVVP